MASIESKRVRATPDTPLTPADMVCVTPPGQNFILMACVTGKNEEGNDQFGVCIYGCFSTIKEAQEWDDVLTKRGLKFQTYIVSANAPLALPPPADESMMDRRYADERLESIMKQWSDKAVKIDDKMDKRIEELRKAEIDGRVQRMKDEREKVDEEDINDFIREYRRSLIGKSDEELHEMAVQNIQKSHTMASNPTLPLHKPPRLDRCTTNHQIQEDPMPIEPLSAKFKIDLNALPKTEEESRKFVEEFYKSGGKMRCKLGTPIPCEKQNFKSGTVLEKKIEEIDE